MKIRWLGHSAFQLENAAGKKLVTDPYDPDTGYEFPADVFTDVVTISHGHHDHAYTEAVKGDFCVFDTAGEHDAAGYRIMGIETYHDDTQGKERGCNIAYVIECDGLRIVHLGDLGHILDKETAGKFGRVDILMNPVGGVYTTDAKGATENANLLQAQLVIPMHYKTSDCKYALLGLDPFLNLMRLEEYNISYRNSDVVEMPAFELPKRPRVYVMDYK